MILFHITVKGLLLELARSVMSYIIQSDGWFIPARLNEEWKGAISGHAAPDGVSDLMDIW